MIGWLFIILVLFLLFGVNYDMHVFSWDSAGCNYGTVNDWLCLSDSQTCLYKRFHCHVLFLNCMVLYFIIEWQEYTGHSCFVDWVVENKLFCISSWWSCVTGPGYLWETRTGLKCFKKTTVLGELHVNRRTVSVFWAHNLKTPHIYSNPVYRKISFVVSVTFCNIFL